MSEQEKRVEDMSDKERTVIEMIRVLYPLMRKYSNSELLKGIRRGWHTDLERLYDAGFCKKEEVRKETAKAILKEFWGLKWGQSELDNVCIRLADKYGVEVKE